MSRCCGEDGIILACDAVEGIEGGGGWRVVWFCYERGRGVIWCWIEKKDSVLVARDQVPVSV